MSPGWTAFGWLRGLGLNQGPPGYEPCDGLSACSPLSRLFCIVSDLAMRGNNTEDSPKRHQTAKC
jgi:hypothetical protein